jgi:hypothetical protein
MAGEPQCSVCKRRKEGFEYGMDCEHELGKVYNGKECYMEYDYADCFETSIVNKNNLAGSLIRRLTDSVKNGICTLKDIANIPKHIFSSISGDSVDYSDIVSMIEKELTKEGAISYKKYPKADDDLSWDGSSAKKRIAEWASSDGSGNKETIDWDKYKNGFAWFDQENKENFGSYKLPHHDIIDGELKTVRAGVVSAQGVMNGAMGGVDIPDGDRESVDSHLSKHRAEFDSDIEENSIDNNDNLLQDSIEVNNANLIDNMNQENNNVEENISQTTENQDVVGDNTDEQGKDCDNVDCSDSPTVEATEAEGNTIETECVDNVEPAEDKTEGQDDEKQEEKVTEIEENNGSCPDCVIEDNSDVVTEKTTTTESVEKESQLIKEYNALKQEKLELEQKLLRSSIEKKLDEYIVSGKNNSGAVLKKDKNEVVDFISKLNESLRTEFFTILDSINVNITLESPKGETGEDENVISIEHAVNKRSELIGDLMKKEGFGYQKARSIVDNEHPELIEACKGNK